jgi:hypothetical protein
MLAGGMVIAAPSMVPEAAAAGQLYVSAENATFGNLFGGGQVVEIIVKDPNRADTEVSESEPTVYVDNNTLRLAQGVDGYWYAYIGAYGFIDASGTEDYDDVDNYLDYGVDTEELGTTGSAGLIGQAHKAVNGTGASDMTSGSSGNMLTATTGVITNPPTLSDYNNTNNIGGDPVTMNADQSSTYGQIGVNATEWPFIQLFDFTQGAFDIVLSQAGQDEIVTLDYDSAGLDSFAGITMDRNTAPHNAEVHLVITDQALNIDPTNEDIVIFYVPAAGTAGTVSFTNGTHPGDYAGGHEAETMGFDDNGVLKINYNTNSVDNDVFANQVTADDPTADQYLVFVEGADNSGVFYNTDDSTVSNLKVSSTAERGSTGTIDYNDSPVSFLVSNSFGTLDMDESTIGDEWNSGETLAVTLVDEDLNLNTGSDESMTLSTTYNSTIPSLQIGSPVSLSADSLIGGGGAGSAGCNIGTFNKICTITSAVTALQTDGVSKYTEFSMNGTTVADMRALASGSSFVFANYDINSLTGTVTNIALVDASGDALYADSSATAKSGLVRITTTIAATSSALVETDTLFVNFTTPTGLVAVTGDVVYLDIFTFGDRVNNAIYRMLLEESDDNTAEFVGDVEFVMLNQINTDLLATYSGLTTISDSLTIIVHEDLTDEDSPRINYLDLGSDGVATQIADQVAAPSHSGVVSFDSANYKTADTVVVTLDDQDLNTDSGLIDVYTTSASDHVGENAAAATSYVMDITFNDVLWQEGESTGATYKGVPDDGLKASGFTLVETDIDSGIFVGSFQVPATYYDSGRSDATTPLYTTTGTDIEVNYNDHRDASGETIEVGDVA